MPPPAPPPVFKQGSPAVLGTGGSSVKAPPKANASTKPCIGWLTDEGCKYGSRCRFFHDKETEDLKGRCFSCSAKDHWANTCPVKAAEKQEEQAKAPSKHKGSGGKSEGKGKAGAKGQSGVRSLDHSSFVESSPSVPHNASSDSAQAKTIVVDPPNPTQELAKEVTEVLRSLRLRKLEVVSPASSESPLARVSSFPLGLGEGAGYGLLDSGATAALRTGSQAEISVATAVSVQLAVGEARMFANAYGTLLTPNEIQPILPMAFLPDLGCSVTWTDRGCSVRHPRKGLLPVRLNHQCPELPVNLVLELINEHEEFLERRSALQAQAKTAVAAALYAPTEISDCPMAWISAQVHEGQLSMDAQAQWLAKLFPELPRRILERVICPVGFNVDRVPYNRHERRRLFDPKVPTLLHLFSGTQRWSDCGHVLHVEKGRGSDLVSNDVFGMLLQAVLTKAVEGAVGGPPCNTTSAYRMAEDGGPRQVRSREGPERFGLSRNTAAEQASVDEASVLWFRTIMLFLLIRVVKGPRAFLGLEHPEDPAQWADPKSPLQQCPSLWVFPELAYAKELLHAFQANFDQGHFGHLCKKPTSFLTTSWVAYEGLAAQRCASTRQSPPLNPTDLREDDPLSPRPGRYQSAAWARWAPGFVKVLKEAWIHHCRAHVAALLQFQEDQQMKLRALSPAWQAHIAADHHPYRKDCAVCLQAASRDRPHYRQTDSSFYALSADISGPFAPGKDVGGPKRYFVAFAIRLPVGESFPWRQRLASPEVFPHGSTATPVPRANTPLPLSGPATRTHNPNPRAALPAPVSDNVGPASHSKAPVPLSGPATRAHNPNPCALPPDPAIKENDFADLLQDLQADSTSEPIQAGPLPPPRRVRGKSSPVKAEPSAEPHSDLRMQFSRDGVPDLSDPAVAPLAPDPQDAESSMSVPVDFIQEPDVPDKPSDGSPMPNREFITLRWAEPLKSRSADQLRLVIMQSVAKCKAFGIPILRFHSDRAKEFQSAKLLRWLAEQSIHCTKSAPEDPQANGTAESAVKELKRAARRCLLSSDLASHYWPLAVRHASELLWRSALSKLGCPVRPLLAFGTKVEARNREWLIRSDKQWGPRSLPGRLVGPAPQTPSAYLVLLEDGQLYVSSSVHPVTPLPAPASVAESLPPCSVHLRLFRASEHDPFSDPFSMSAFSSDLRPAVILRALRSPSPYGGGGAHHDVNADPSPAESSESSAPPTSLAGENQAASDQVLLPVSPIGSSSPGVGVSPIGFRQGRRLKGMGFRSLLESHGPRILQFLPASLTDPVLRCLSSGMRFRISMARFASLPEGQQQQIMQGLDSEETSDSTPDPGYVDDMYPGFEHAVSEGSGSQSVSPVFHFEGETSNPILNSGGGPSNSMLDSGGDLVEPLGSSIGLGRFGKFIVSPPLLNRVSEQFGPQPQRRGQVKPWPT